jgi:hypothetical protein
MSMKGTKWNQFLNVFEKKTRNILGATKTGTIGSSYAVIGASTTIGGKPFQRNPSQPNTYAARSG